MGETIEFSITRASQLTIPNKDWTHYRSGLKIRCTSGSLGVTLAVISQGKSIDTTMITATNVRFLTKEPIVGLKVSDGEQLRKRLQITFSSEGNFNMFANKIQQWLGISVVANYDASDSQLANSQSGAKAISHPQTRGTSVSQTAVGNCVEDLEYPLHSLGSQSVGTQMGGSQSFSDVPTSQVPCSGDRSSQFAPNQNYSQQSEATQYSPFRRYNEPSQFPNSQSKTNGENSPQNYDVFSMLVNTATKDSTRSVSQFDNSALSQSTQIWNEVERDSTLQYPTVNNTRYSETIAGVDLTQTLRNIPFNPTQKSKGKKPPHSTRKRGMEEFLERTIARIVEEKQKGYLDLTDEDLSLKICKKLKSKSFLQLLKRVENLLN